MMVAAEEPVEAPARELAEYRYRLNKKRRQVVRTALNQVMGRIDVAVRSLRAKYEEESEVARQVATCGRFTADAVALIDKHNGSDRALQIEMWPESHLEHLLASRPAIIAEFGLR